MDLWQPLITMTIERELHACIEIQSHATLFSYTVVNMAEQHELQVHESNKEKKNVAQQGSHTPANTKSCSLGLQRTSLILNKQVIVN